MNIDEKNAEIHRLFNQARKAIDVYETEAIEYGYRGDITGMCQDEIGLATSKVELDELDADSGVLRITIEVRRGGNYENL